MTDEQILLIHRVIHKLVTPHNGVRFGDRTYQVNTLPQGLRCMKVGNTLWIEQNLEKNSAAAARGRAGARITWGIREDQPWALVENERVLRR